MQTTRQTSLQNETPTQHKHGDGVSSHFSALKEIRIADVADIKFLGFLSMPVVLLSRFFFCSHPRVDVLLSLVWLVLMAH